MGIQKGSFYATFGSKHEIFVADLCRYTLRRFQDFECRLEGLSPRSAILEMFSIVDAECRSRDGKRGCFLVNMALAFAREGAKVAIGARREAEGQDVVREIKAAGGEAIFVKTDVSKPDEVANLVDSTISAWGHLEIAFNNAGTEGAGLAPIAEDSSENVQIVMDINVMGVWNSMRAEIPHLSERGGVIINTPRW